MCQQSPQTTYPSSTTPEPFSGNQELFAYSLAANIYYSLPISPTKSNLNPFTINTQTFTYIMSADAAAEPGVPVENTEPSYIPPAGEKSVAKEVEKRAPSGLLDIASKPDRIILRLNKYVQVSSRQRCASKRRLPIYIDINTSDNTSTTDSSQPPAAPAPSSQPSTTRSGSSPSSKPNPSPCRPNSSNT